MPTYVLECSECGWSEERFLSIKSPKCFKCPNCDKDTLIRQMGSGCGWFISGSGVYKPGWTYKNKEG